jgi:hypothetical protein
MKRADCFCWVMAVVVLTFTFMAGLWILDVSAGAIASEGGVFINLLGVQNPFVSYHIGLFMAVVSFVVMATIAVYHVIGAKGDD